MSAGFICGSPEHILMKFGIGNLRKVVKKI